LLKSQVLSSEWNSERLRDDASGDSGEGDKNRTRVQKKKEKTISYSVQTGYGSFSGTEIWAKIINIQNATFKHNPTYCIFKLPQKYFTSYYWKKTISNYAAGARQQENKTSRCTNFSPNILLLFSIRNNYLPVKIPAAVVIDPLCALTALL